MFDVLFPMHQFDFHTKFLIQVLCQVLGWINRTMLSAGATEADGQIAESAFHITFHGGIYQSIDMIEEASISPSSSKKVITGSSSPVKGL